MLSISLIVLLAGVVLLLIRKSGLRPIHAAITALFGFYLASTAAAPSIHNAVGSLASWVGHIHP